MKITKVDVQQQVNCICRYKLVFKILELRKTISTNNKLPFFTYLMFVVIFILYFPQNNCYKYPQERYFLKR